MHVLPSVISWNPAPTDTYNIVPFRGELAWPQQCISEARGSNEGYIAERLEGQLLNTFQYHNDQSEGRQHNTVCDEKQIGWRFDLSLGYERETR